MDQNTAIKSLAALAHDSRLSVMRRLIQAGFAGVGSGELADFAKVGASTASAQLLVLANAGLVTPHRDGRHINYVANYERFKELLAFLMDDCCAGHFQNSEPFERSGCS